MEKKSQLAGNRKGERKDVRIFYFVFLEAAQERQKQIPGDCCLFEEEVSVRSTRAKRNVNLCRRSRRRRRQTVQDENKRKKSFGLCVRHVVTLRLEAFKVDFVVA